MNDDVKLSPKTCLLIGFSGSLLDTLFKYLSKDRKKIFRKKVSILKVDEKKKKCKIGK